MAADLTTLLNLRSTTLLDLDDQARALVSNDESGSGQLYEITADGQWRQLTHFSDPATGRYLPGSAGGRTLVISADDGGTERTQLWQLDLDAPAEGVTAGQPQPMVHDPDYIHTLLDVFDDQIIYSTNRRNGVEFDIVARTASTGAERVLFDGGGWFNEVAVSPDGRWIAASRLTLVPASTQVLLIEVSSGATTEITSATAPGNWTELHWLPDSSGLLASSDSEAERYSIRRFDLTLRDWTFEIGEPNVDLSAIPSPDGRLWAVVRSVDGADELLLYPASSDNRPSDVVDQIELPGSGVASYRSRIVWSPDSSSLGLTFTSPVQPPEAYVWTAASGLRRRSTSNQAALLEGLVEPEIHRVSSFDGEQVPLFVMRPSNADGSAVLIIHGGPESATVRSFNPVAAGLTLAGHTVLLPNVRGSAGYGHRWVSLDDVEKRLDSVADLAAIHGWLPSIGLDPERAALYGGSYGGYMVLAGLTFYPDLWAAGVDIVGISSLTTFMENTSAYRRAYREREYGSLAEHRDGFAVADHRQAPRAAVHHPRRQRPAGAVVGGGAGRCRGSGKRVRMRVAGVRRRGTWPVKARQSAGRIPAGGGVPAPASGLTRCLDPTGEHRDRLAGSPLPGLGSLGFCDPGGVLLAMRERQPVVSGLGRRRGRQRSSQFGRYVNGSGFLVSFEQHVDQIAE
ncbi:MAG TPA: alpha/beta fold hydrolase [Jatrophihabitans sp.]|jgi:dipeptidyl aminopeptidase/acylaminoacyl peptidase